jgi:hypothetical protein
MAVACRSSAGARRCHGDCVSDSGEFRCAFGVGLLGEKKREGRGIYRQRQLGLGARVRGGGGIRWLR